MKKKPEVVVLFDANEFRNVVSGGGIHMTAIDVGVVVNTEGQCVVCGAGIEYDRDKGVIQCVGEERENGTGPKHFLHNVPEIDVDD